MIDHKVRHQTNRQEQKLPLGIPKLTELLQTQTTVQLEPVHEETSETRIILPDLDVSRQGKKQLESFSKFCP